MLKTWIGLGLGIALTGVAYADDQKPNDTNQAGPVESNTNGGGLTREGNVIDRTGTDTSNPADSTAPTNEQVDTNSDQTTGASFDNETPDLVVIPRDVPTNARHRERERLGIGISLGGGTSGFTSDSLRGATNTGGEWNVRATFGTRSLLAVEGSYIGSAQPISALGVDSSAVLVGNGVQGALRLNGTIDAPVQPFVFAGAAWRRYDLTNTNINTSDLSDSDDVLEFPMGVGLSARWSGLLLDARGEYRLATNEDLLTNASMDRWGVNANVGYEF